MTYIVCYLVTDNVFSYPFALHLLSAVSVQQKKASTSIDVVNVFMDMVDVLSGDVLSLY
jgi:hypothetical protein